MEIGGLAVLVLRWRSGEAAVFFAFGDCMIGACFSTAWCTFFLLPGFDICFTREGEMVDGPGTTLLYANTLPSHEQQAWQIAQAHVSSYHGVATGVTRAASMIGGE